MPLWRSAAVTELCHSGAVIKGVGRLIVVELTTVISAMESFYSFLFDFLDYTPDGSGRHVYSYVGSADKTKNVHN